jgi:hypothetical protein
MIEYHGPDGGFGTWTRSATLDSSAVEDALKTAEKAALEQVASEGKQLFNIYLTFKYLEAKLKQLILQGGESAAMVQSAVNSFVRILQFTRTRFLMARQGKVNGNLKDLHEAPHGSTFIKHNGALGVAGHFISTIDVDQASINYWVRQLFGKKKQKKYLQPTRIQTTVAK